MRAIDRREIVRGTLMRGTIHLVSRQALVRLHRRDIRLRRNEAASILSVGALSAASTTLFQISTFLVAGLIAKLGNATVAAYGAAAGMLIFF